MRRLLKFVLFTALALSVWTLLVVAGTLDGWWREPLAPRGDPRAFMDAAVQRIEAVRRGNVAFILIEDGVAYNEHFASAGRPVDRDSLFQVASLSKWVSAWGVMALVEQGALDLDAPVSRYLTRWQLPPSPFDNDGVTVRRLLSHTAGLTDGLGYAGFRPGEPLQPLEASLSRAADASPGASGEVRVGAAPGGGFLYSGGGYTLLQLVIEEVSGQPFHVFMQARILEPLGMWRSTYVVDDDVRNIAEVHALDGSPAVVYEFTSLAATSLYTSAADLTRFLQAHLTGPRGEPAGRGVLRPETLVEMRRPHARQFGADIWGLGTMLYAPNGAGDFVIGHDGDNEPAINTAARLNPSTGDGIVLLETGNTLLATTIASEWVYWNTGNVDFLMVTMTAGESFQVLAAGWMAIVVAACAIAWRLRRPRMSR